MFESCVSERDFNVLSFYYRLYGPVVSHDLDIVSLSCNDIL